jgi:SAM-dependent MidA family methyltransferase
MVVERIADEIADSGGWIGFDRYMQLVLYAPGLGYYTAGAIKLGGSGDFVTAPELSPLFSQTLARQIAEVLSVTGGDVLELGAGSGRKGDPSQRGI